MSIRFVILGLLSETPLTGYDLKKKIAASSVFHWSGNSNQIYKSLLDLSNDGLVTVEVQHQTSKPPRKVYSLTENGVDALTAWLTSDAELPQFQNSLLLRLMWADRLEPAALTRLLTAYADDLSQHIALLQEQQRRENTSPPANPPVRWLDRVAEHGLDFYVRELLWVQSLLAETAERHALPPLPSSPLIRQGDLYWAAPVTPDESETAIAHPHVVIQDDVLNASRIDTVVVCALTSNIGRVTSPGNVLLEAGEGGLSRQSVVEVSKVASVAKAQLGDYIGSLSSARIEQILAGLRFLQRAHFSS